MIMHAEEMFFFFVCFFHAHTVIVHLQPPPLDVRSVCHVLWAFSLASTANSYL